MKLFLQQIFSTILKWICEFFPKNKKMILIGTPNAIDYYDNSKYFFEFLYKKESNDFSFFLITKNKKSYTHLKNKFGDPVLYAFSFKAITVYLRSKFVLLVNGNGDIFPALESVHSWLASRWGHASWNYHQISWSWIHRERIRYVLPPVLGCAPGRVDADGFC